MDNKIVPINRRVNIIINFQFAAIHNWVDCDLDFVSYLKNPHRHVFHVTMKFKVNHNNRDIEFINKKTEILDFIRINYENEFLENTSCEMLATELIEYFKKEGCFYVRVMEDGENGAEVEI